MNEPTVCVHFSNTKNVGDLACSPCDYFEIGPYSRLAFGTNLGQRHTAIFGGGQGFGQAVDALIYDSTNVKHKVFWALGISEKNASSVMFDIVAAQTNLISSRRRDIAGCDWVPCVTAMSDMFDREWTIKHDVVQFLHHAKSSDVPKMAGCPTLTNWDCSFEQAIEFIASGRTVVTNSYHGTYWAMCLGRQVLCLPFSDKFSGFLQAPKIADPTDWFDDIKSAYACSEVLDHARLQNRAFFKKCVNEGAIIP